MEMSNGGQPDPASAQTGTSIKAANNYIDLDPGKLGVKAADFAVRMLGATDGETTESDIIFPPETGYGIIDLVADMVSADLVQKKKSLFSGRVGQRVASNQVNIIDNGNLKDGLASAAIDAEGIPTGETEIIKDGVLAGLLYDSYTAHRGNARPTGNSDRLSYSARPSIAPTNFYLKAGNLSRDSFLASADRSIYITEVSGLHAAVDPITGNFSIPSKGIMVQSGELTQPITNITISGNIFDLLKNIDGIADDLTWETRGNVIGVPTFRVKGIKIGGK
jgi:PmbA protein